MKSKSSSTYIGLQSASVGLQQSQLDACLFFLVENNCVVLLVGCHVDDLIIVGVRRHVTWIRGR